MRQQLTVTREVVFNEIRNIHSLHVNHLLQLDELPAHRLTVILTNEGRCVLAALGWTGADWLHIDALEERLPCVSTTRARVLDALEAAAVQQGCRYSQAEISCSETQIFLQQHGYRVTRTFQAGGDDWVILHKHLTVPSSLDLALRIRSALNASRGLLKANEAAALLNLSTSRFRHQFRKNAGQSFRSARLAVKLEHAANLMRETPLTIPEISAQLGYSDRTKLEKAFKRFFGVTPAQYRKDLIGR